MLLYLPQNINIVLNSWTGICIMTAAIKIKHFSVSESRKTVDINLLNHRITTNKRTSDIRHSNIGFVVSLLNACTFIALYSVTISNLSEVCASLPISLPPVIRLGAIFTEDQRASKIESAFKYAIYRINKDKTMLPDTQIVYDIEYIPRDDTFRSTKKVCRQLESGVQAIFGPTDPLLATHIQSICESFDIPHIETRIDLEPNVKEFSINMYPSQHSLNLAYRDLMFYLNWTKVAIIYEEDYALFKQQDLMQATSEMPTEMYIRQVTPDTYRQVLRAIRQKEIYKIIVDTNPENINLFFRAILQLQMNDYRYHYMFTTFDLETFDLEDFKYNGVNITAFRLVDVESKRYQEIIEQMQKFPHSGLNMIEGRLYIQTLPALMFDAVYAFATGLMALDGVHTLQLRNLSCDLEEPWNDGLSLYNYINTANINGLTGKIDLTEGRRNKFKIDLLKLKQERIVKVGFWTLDEGINITDPKAFYDTHTANITLLVMTREEKPYVMVKDDANLTGNARFEGFCIDLLKVIAAQVGFHYKIEVVPDNMYGVYNPETQTWNGIVRELMERRADLAVASMTINYARESVIDFTKPFMNLGIGILFKKSDRAQTRFFSFMNPLAVDIWIYIGCGYVLVSLTIWIVARFSPLEWVPSKYHTTTLNMLNAFDETNETGSHIKGYHVHEDIELIQNQYFTNEDNIDGNEKISEFDVKNELMQTKSNVAISNPKSTDLWWPDNRLHLPTSFLNMEDNSIIDPGKSTELLTIRNHFTLRNCFWFAISALMQQSSDLYPRVII